MTNFSAADTGIDAIIRRDETPATSAAIPNGIRDLQFEWIGNSRITSGLSLIRRPDAVSMNYQLCYTPGPVNFGDSSGGPLARIWRCYVEGLSVKIQRNSVLENAWEAPTEVFTFIGPELTEIDAAFNQNAQVFVCAESPTGASGAPEIWIYWFDPIAGDYVFEVISSGRSPKVSLDDFQNVSNSDLIVFYFKLTGELVYRVQRERYLTEHATPVIDVDGYVEDVYQSSDFRLTVLYSVRDAASGRYTLQKLVTTLYDFTVDTDEFSLSTTISSADIQTLIITYGESAPFVEEEYSLNATIIAASVAEPIIQVYPEGTTFKDDIETFSFVTTITAATIVVTPTLYTNYTAFDIDTVAPTVTIISAAIDTIVITYNAYDVDEAKLTVTIPTITIV